LDEGDEPEIDIVSRFSVSQLDFIIADLMVFYKGAVTYSDFMCMPIDEILQLQYFAHNINKEVERRNKQASKGL
jgi:hypothetical protein